MDNNLDNQFINDINPLPEKPQFLKVLCILSFIGCGLTIICLAIGTCLLGFNEEMVNSVWEKMVQSQPKLEDVNAMEFIHAIGMYCVYALIANIFSLIGVILMWRLNRVGFFIYAVAELVINFFDLSVNVNTENKSNGGMIFMILLDLVFIVMYATNLKYMKKKAVSIPQ